MKKFNLIDVCLPDYFQGYSKEIIVIPVDGNTTVADIIHQIEYYDICDISDFDCTDIEFDSAITELKDNHKNADIIAFPSLDMVEDDSCYAYFSIE